MTMPRRSVLQGIAASGALSAMFNSAQAQAPSAASPDRRILIKGAYVASLDPALGEIEGGDVLIESGRIAQVGRKLSAPDAEIVDGRKKVVLPGLIDTHRHTWETLTRSWISEGDLAVYQKVINGVLGPRFRPEDVYIGNLLGALGALNSGITTLLDWSHIMNSPAHADAAIKGLADSGMRCVFAYGYSPIPGFDEQPGAEERRVADVRRVHKQYFQNPDQLLTMAIAARNDLQKSIADIKLARELGIRTTMHITRPGRIVELDKAGMLGPDLTYVHTVGREATDDEYRLMAAHGGTISTSSATEMMSGHGFPSAQRWLKYGLRPSFSVDNETRMPSDLFAQMRALVISDHMLESDRARNEGGRPIVDPRTRRAGIRHHRGRAYDRARQEGRHDHARQARGSDHRRS